MSLNLTLEYVRARAGGEAFAFERGPTTYLARAPAGGFQELVFDWDDALLRDLATLGAARPDPAAAARVGARLRALVRDTPLRPVEPGLGAGASARLHIRSAAAELYALPWELLTLEPSGCALGQLGAIQLHFGWPEATPAPRAAAPGDRVLFAWSDAGGPVPWAAQRDAIARAAAGVLPLNPAHDVLAQATPNRLDAALTQARAAGRPFTAIHLLCHGLPGPEGGRLLLDPDAATDAATLRGLLAPHLDAARLVVLSACEAASPGAMGGPIGGAALALHRAGAEAVVAARHPLRVDASLALTEVLYEELLQRSNSLEGALSLARRAMQLQGGGADPGLMLWRHNTDPHDLRPVTLRPYRGLLMFEAADARYFFGRDEERAALLARVRAAARGQGPRFLLLCGATGSGKSSLLRAGLIPALQTEGWRAVVLRAAGELMPELDAALDALPDDGRLLVVVDPLQELFTAIPDPAERVARVTALWEAARDPRVVVLSGIRVDYLGRCEEIHLDRGARRLDTLLYDETHRIFLATPGPTELRAAALGPASAVGLEFEPGLLDLLVADAGEAPGALPALQHALDRLWAAREGRVLTHAAYRAMGGLSGALAGWADQVLASLSPPERAAARRLLVSLVSVSADGRLAARRARSLDALLPSDTAARQATQAALEALAQGRLLVVDAQGGGVGAELAHEALLRHWQTLRAWVAEDQERHRHRAQLEAAAVEWAEHRGDADGGQSYLLQGLRLGLAEELVTAGRVSAEAAAWVRVSRAAEDERERARLAELAERERLAREALAAASRARDAALLASARAARERDPTLALQLLREVQGASQPLDWTREAWAALASPLVVEAWQGSAGPDPAARLRPGGAMAWLRLEGTRCTLRGRRNELPGFETERRITLAAWSPEGRAICAVTDDQQIWWWDGASLVGLGRESATITRLRVAPDGHRVAIGLIDGRVRIWAREETPPITLRGHVGAVFDLDWRPDGAALLSASEDGTARLWQPERAECATHRGFDKAVTAARFSPDGRAFAATSLDGTLRVWDAGRGGEGVRQLLGAPLRCAAWGQALLVGDATGRILAIAQEHPPIQLRGEHGPVVGVAWLGGDPLGVSEDGTWRRWRLDAPAASRCWPAGLRRTASLAWRGDGRAIAGAGPDGAIAVLEVDPPVAAQATLLGHRGAVRALAWCPDGQRLLSASNDDSARIWRPMSRELVARLHGHDGALTAAAWHGDGQWLATGDATGRVRLWRADGAPIDEVRRGLDNEISALSFSDRGTWLLAIGADHTALVARPDGSAPWVLGTPWTRRTQSSPAHAYAVACWAGDRLLLGALDGTVAEADPTDRTIRPLARLPSAVTALAAPDPRLIAATQDGGVYLVEAASPTALLDVGPPATRWLAAAPSGRLLVGLDTLDQLWVSDLLLPGDRVALPGPSRTLLAALSPTGGLLAQARDDGVVSVWPLSDAAILAQLHEATALPLTLAQRRKYLGETGAGNGATPTSGVRRSNGT